MYMKYRQLMLLIRVLFRCDMFALGLSDEPPTPQNRRFILFREKMLQLYRLSPPARSAVISIVKKLNRGNKSWKR